MQDLSIHMHWNFKVGSKSYDALLHFLYIKSMSLPLPCSWYIPAPYNLQLHSHWSMHNVSMIPACNMFLRGCKTDKTVAGFKGMLGREDAHVTFWIQSQEYSNFGTGKLQAFLVAETLVFHLFWPIKHGTVKLQNKHCLWLMWRTLQILIESIWSTFMLQTT